MEHTTGVYLDTDARIRARGKTWTFEGEGELKLENGYIRFSEAREVARKALSTGLGEGVSTVYGDFPGHEGLRFETRALVNATTGDIDFSFVALQMEGVRLREVRWPCPLRADAPGSYAVLNTMQGQLVPVDWPRAIGEKLPFDGQMCTESAYMPWWGEISPDGGYMAVVRQPWDAAMEIAHPAGGPTRVRVRHLPSLGRMEGARTVTYCFFPAGCDYNTLCARYREMADEEGKAVTLREKALRNPSVARLVGCCVLHVGCKTHVSPDSAYYNREQPEKNDSLTPFCVWEARVKQLRAMGVSKLYMHLDGWGQPGYDNRHPDYLPPCAEAGGWPGLRALSDAVRGEGYLFGIHDQYRDYYLDAASYDPDNAVLGADGRIFEMARWAGGKQNYLCAALAPAYVKRNFEALRANGVKLDAAYLDVFTCNEPDECANPRHRMTRRECVEEHLRCFDYLTARGIAPSSEEVNDWAMRSLVFCHWAPYLGNTAIPAPLFNLVYHDCVMIPWVMGGNVWGIPEGTNGFLHALLNGGMGYLDADNQGDALRANIRQCETLRALHTRVAMEKMTAHRFLNASRTRQQTEFTGGVRVTVDFESGAYEIEDPSGEACAIKV